MQHLSKGRKECIWVKYLIYAVLSRFQICHNLRVFSAKSVVQKFQSSQHQSIGKLLGLGKTKSLKSKPKGTTLQADELLRALTFCQNFREKIDIMSFVFCVFLYAIVHFVLLNFFNRKFIKSPNKSILKYQEQIQQIRRKKNNITTTTTKNPEYGSH